MQLPIFYVPEIAPDKVVLDEDTSRHVVQVLRMGKGEELLLTDGKGKKARTVIEDDHRKRCEVKILAVDNKPKPQPEITIGVSLVKNTARFEWFLEKATEIGVSRIIPLICGRTEREKFRYDRLHGIMESAMVQSGQWWLPELLEPTEFKVVLSKKANQNLIAHCVEQERSSLHSISLDGNVLILVGPEGDFTPEEIEAAMSAGFQPVSLGETRLRTETAGIVAATLLTASRRSPRATS